MNAQIGKKIEIVVKREEQLINLEAEIGSRPNPNPLSLDSDVAEIEGFSPLSRGNVVGVIAGSPLWNAGLRSGDRVLRINALEIKTYRDLLKLTESKETILSFEAERGEGAAQEKISVTIPRPEVATSSEMFFQMIGLESSELYLAKVMDKSPAAKAGLLVGDRLISIAGVSLKKWEDVLENIKSYNGTGGVAIDFQRGTEKKTITIEPEVTTQMTAFGSEDKRYTIGISPTVDITLPEITLERTLNPITAVAQGAQMSWDYSVITVLSFVRLFQNKISHKTVGGLLSIGQAAGETMKLGIGKFLLMMAIISINLFILNLLPVPVLDGGHLVFYIIEVIKGSPLSIRKMEAAQQVGMFLLMGLMVFALFNDVTRIIFGRM